MFAEPFRMVFVALPRKMGDRRDSMHEITPGKLYFRWTQPKQPATLILPEQQCRAATETGAERRRISVGSRMTTHHPPRTNWKERASWKMQQRC